MIARTHPNLSHFSTPGAARCDEFRLLAGEDEA
jgi:hypothetical protein